MALNQNILREIEKIITEECGLVDQYLSLLDSEQEQVIKLKSEQVSGLSERRAVVADRLAGLRQGRDDLVRELNNNSKITLSELIAQRGSTADKKRLLPLIQKLKKKLKVFDDRNKEFSQIINFTLGLVNGSLSILWSATQTVTRCYNAFGAITESFQPTAPRVGTLLGKA
jgi:FlgN protein